MQRDFTYIDDIVQGIIITLNNPPARFEREKGSEGARVRKDDSKTVKHTSSPVINQENQLLVTSYQSLIQVHRFTSLQVHHIINYSILEMDHLSIF